MFIFIFLTFKLKYISHSKQSVMKETIFKCLTFLKVSERSCQIIVIAKSAKIKVVTIFAPPPPLQTTNKNVLFIEMWTQAGRSTGFNAIK